MENLDVTSQITNWGWDCKNKKIQRIKFNQVYLHKTKIYYFRRNLMKKQFITPDEYLFMFVAKFHLYNR